jgi:hypothetical protein
MNTLLHFNMLGRAPSAAVGQYVNATIIVGDQSLHCSCHTFMGAVHWPNMTEFASPDMPSISFSPNDDYLDWELAMHTDKGVEVQRMINGVRKTVMADATEATAHPVT